MLSITCPSSTLGWPAFRNRMLSGSSSCPVASRSSGYSYLKVTTWRYPSSLETARWIGRTLLTSSRWYRWIARSSELGIRRNFGQILLAILRYTIGRFKCGSTPTLAHNLTVTGHLRADSNGSSSPALRAFPERAAASPADQAVDIWLHRPYIGVRCLLLRGVDKLLVDFQADMRRIKGAGR